MDKIQIINEQFQRPETLSRIAKNQSMQRQESLSKGDEAIQNGLAVQGKALGEKLKQYMEGKDIHNDAEKTLQKSLTMGNLMGRASDEKMQNRTRYKDGMYNESLDELEVLNQTEDVAAMDFNNKMMSEMANFAEQPQEAFEESLLGYFNGIKEKYKDKPAYANGLITKYSGMAQSLMANYTKQRQAVLQRQANQASQRMKIQTADAFTGGMMAAGIDEEERSKVREQYKASLSLQARGKESEEAFVTTHFNAQLTMLDNGNIEPFKIYKDSEAYAMLSDTQRTKIETAEKSYNKKVLSGLREKMAKARFAAVSGDMSLYNEILTKDIAATGARLSGHIDAQEELAEITSSVAEGYEKREEKRQRELDRSLKAKEIQMNKEDRDTKMIIGLYNTKMETLQKAQQLAKTPEEQAMVALQIKNTEKEFTDIAMGINNDVLRSTTVQQIQLKGQNVELDTAIEQNKEIDKNNVDIFKTAIESSSMIVTKETSYSNVEISSMTEEEMQRNDRIMNENINRLEEIAIDNRAPLDIRNEAKKKALEARAEREKYMQKYELYGRAKEGIDREETKNFHNKYQIDFGGGNIENFKAIKALEGKKTSDETNKREVMKIIDVLSKMPKDSEGNSYKANNLQEKMDIIMKHPEAVRQLSIIEGFGSITADYFLNKKNDYNVSSNEVPTEEEYKKAVADLQLNKIHNTMPLELKMDAIDIETAYRNKVAPSTLRKRGATEAKKIGGEVSKIIQNNPKLSSLPYHQQRNFAETYNSILETGIAPIEAEKRALEHITNNKIQEDGISVSVSKDISKLNAHKLVTVKVKGLEGGEKNVSVFNVLNEFAREGGFNNMFGLKDGSYTTLLGSPYVGLKDIKEIADISLTTIGNEKVIIVKSTAPNGESITINQNTIENMAKLYAARQKTLPQALFKGAREFDVADYSLEYINFIKEGLNMLEIKEEQ